MPNTSLYDNYKKNEIRKRKGHFSSLFFFYIIPFILINLIIFYIVTATPKVTISIAEPINFNTVELTVVKNSLFPTRSISAKFENEDLQLRKIGRNLYFASVNKNGSLEVEVTNLNGMSKIFYEYIGSIDDNPPTIDGLIEDKTITVSFSDEDSGINYDSIYATDFNGERIDAEEIDKINNSAIFEYNGLSLEVHVSDNAGNEVNAAFSDRVE